MSLINQMLKDLESRHASEELAQRAAGGMGMAARRHSRRRNLVIGGLASLVLLLAIISAYLYWQKTLESSTAVAASTPVAKPASKPAAKRPATPLPDKPVLVEKRSSGGQPVQPVKPAGITLPDGEEVIVGAPAKKLVHKAPVKKTVAKKATPRKPRVAADEHIEKRLLPQTAAERAEQHYQEGHRLLRQGDQKGAEENWRETLRLAPAHISATEALSVLYLSQGRRIEAAEQLQQGVYHHPTNGKLALLYARMQLEAEDMAAAVHTLETAMQKAQSADFYAFAAAVYQRQKDFPKSVAAYESALKLQPKKSVWWMGLGISLEGAGKSAEALSAYNEAKKGHLAPKLKEYVESRIDELD